MRALALLVLLLGVEPGLQRFKIEERVRVMEKTRPDAKVCLVHLHGNEVNGREVMLELLNAKGSCANGMWLDDAFLDAPWQDDRIPVPSGTSPYGKCTVNPNRILTPSAFAHRIDFDCEDDAIAKKELRRFLDETFLPALARCRANNLPVVAFHNNSRLTVRDMDAGRSAPNAERPSDILFVTNADDFAKLAALERWSVALQNDPPADDGSLSVLLRKDRYINVEAQVAPPNKARNRAMAEDALRVLGALDCAAPAH